MADVYLIKRGPRPAGHLAPFHPVIVCAKRDVARWEAGWTGDAAWVWSHERGLRVGGWLLERWNGFNVDYGHVVRGVTMPDGTDAAFVHESTGREPWSLLSGAIWWDVKRMPAWLAESGVVDPPDGFSQGSIVRALARASRGGDQVVRPAHWPTPAEHTRWEIEEGARIPNGVAVQVPTGIGCYARDCDGVVVGLQAQTEPPNGRYHDEYRVRLTDGDERTVYRFVLEQRNPTAVVPAAATTEGAHG